MKTICIPTAVTRGAVFHYSGMYIHYVEQSTILCSTRKCMSKTRAILVYCVCVCLGGFSCYITSFGAAMRE